MMKTRKLSLLKVLLSLVGFLFLWAIVTDAWGYSELLFHAEKGTWEKYIFNLVNRLIWAIPAIVLLRLYKEDLPTKWNELFLNKPHKRPFIIAAAVIILYCFAGMLFSHGGIWLNPQFNCIKDFLKLLMVAFAEELVYRGWGLNALSVFMSKRAANLVSTLFFVLLHLPAYFIKFYLIGTIPLAAMAFQCFFVFILGLLFGYLYNRGRSLWSPMVVHFLADFLSIMVIG
ncbi:CPBP family intramembrane glutamic endopeptidase [Oscillospiraceae bacterium MB08-C2-2]|nr:CPBP family intramembrane glutamic endopeptidase [Oscillospiraceae bacterium MB08-C2-2]